MSFDIDELLEQVDWKRDHDRVGDVVERRPTTLSIWAPADTSEAGPSLDDAGVLPQRNGSVGVDRLDGGRVGLHVGAQAGSDLWTVLIDLSPAGARALLASLKETLAMTDNAETIPVPVIDLTPSWAFAAQVIDAALTSGTPEGQRMAREELASMARAADSYVRLLRAVGDAIRHDRPFEVSAPIGSTAAGIVVDVHDRLLTDGAGLEEREVFLRACDPQSPKV